MKFLGWIGTFCWFTLATIFTLITFVLIGTIVITIFVCAHFYFTDGGSGSITAILMSLIVTGLICGLVIGLIYSG